MNKTKKLYGFRLGESIPKWVDRFGREGGKIVRLIWLDYLKKFQIIISNGDILTRECILQDDYFKRGLANRKNNKVAKQIGLELSVQIELEKQNLRYDLGKENT